MNNLNDVISVWQLWYQVFYVGRHCRERWNIPYLKILPICTNTFKYTFSTDYLYHEIHFWFSPNIT